MQINIETDINKWRKKLNEQVIPIKRAQQPRNLISDWMNTGVINDNRQGDGKKRYLNYIDFFWLCIVIKLRALGYRNNHLKKARELLFRNIKSDVVDGEIPTLEEAVLRMTVKNDPLFLELSEHGDASIFDESTYHYGARAGFYTCYVMIRLNRLFKEQIKNILFKTEFIDYASLTDQEQQVIDALGSDNTQSIKVIKKNDQIDLIEIEQDIKTHHRIIDILKDQDYQTIEVKQHNGNVSKITRTVKFKTDSKKEK